MLALIDMDVMCYQACESRWKLRCEGLNHIIELDGEGQRKQLEFTRAEDTKYLKDSYDNLKRDLDKLLDMTFASDFLAAVKCPATEGPAVNFRNVMYPEYKLNRHKDPDKSNGFVPILRQLMVAEGLAVEASGREADDLICIWSEEARAKGEEFIICTIDKDIWKAIPGNHYLMHPWLTADNRIVVTNEEDACRFHYEQLLKGDPTDYIPGIPRIGDKKAEKILAPYNTEADFQEQVVNQYIEAYGDEWMDYLLSNGKMLYLQRHVDDYFECLHWPIVQELTL
jgi:hypothetical protein